MQTPDAQASTKAWTDTPIRAHRMGTLIIRAAPGAAVTVTQLRHEFAFGTAIACRMFRDDADPEARRQYQEILAANFNAAVHENALKWYHTERAGPGNPLYDDADRMLAWCERRGIRMRGHCVYWGIEKYVQPWLQGLDDAALRTHLARRGQEVTARYRDRITEYDLNNEMIHGDYYAQRLGEGITGEMFAWAKEGDPAARLYVNDYGIISGKDAPRYLEHIRALIDRGVPVGGIGVQGHFGGHVDPMHVARVLQDLAAFHLPIKVTEFDMDTDDEDAKARGLEDLYRVAFANPAVDGILMWGFWEGAHWRPKAALWKRDFTPTKAAAAYRALVFSEWWTRFAGHTDANGECRVPAFFGQHRVACGERAIEVCLTKTDREVNVSLLDDPTANAPKQPRSEDGDR